MYGAIIGDIVGSVYEFDNIKHKNFPLFCERSIFTDDSIMTVAVAKAIVKTKIESTNRSIDASNIDVFKNNLMCLMREYGKKYPHPVGGYGVRFSNWLAGTINKAYNSFGNGSAMRVSPCAIYAVELEEALMLAKASAEVTHNHPEGIKGAQATAAAIFLAKSSKSKDEIRSYIEANYYSLDFTLDSIRSNYSFDETCQGTAPQAIVAFLESNCYEDAIRNAISLGGDSDTLGAITGSIAWAFYQDYYHGEKLFEGSVFGPVKRQILLTPDMASMREEAEKRLPKDIAEFVEYFVGFCLSYQGYYNRMTDYTGFTVSK